VGRARVLAAIAFLTCLAAGAPALTAAAWGAPIAATEAPAAPTAPADLTFCVFGDTRTGGEAKRLGIVNRIAADMAAERPRLVLGTGDYIDGGSDPRESRGQLERLLAALQPLQANGPVPLAGALGNHDRSLDARTLQAFLGPPYFSFDLEGCHFVILDTQQPDQYGRVDGKQWQWLVADLRSAQQSRFIFVTMHQPLFPVSVHRDASLDKYPRFRDRLHQLFVQQNVTCVFAGHEHLYDRQERDGVVYVITAGAGAPLYAQPGAGGYYHYLRVFVSGNHYEVQVKRLP